MNREEARELRRAQKDHEEWEAVRQEIADRTFIVRTEWPLHGQVEYLLESLRRINQNPKSEFFFFFHQDRLRALERKVYLSLSERNSEKFIFLERAKDVAKEKLWFEIFASKNLLYRIKPSRQLAKFSIFEERGTLVKLSPLLIYVNSEFDGKGKLLGQFETESRAVVRKSKQKGR